MATRGKKILVGCGIGCLAVVLLAVGSCTGFFIWLKQPGELLEPDLLVGSDTKGYLAWTLRLEDPGTEQFVQDILNSMQRVQRKHGVKINPTVDSFLNRMQQKKNEREIRKMFPLAAAWTLRPGDDPGDDLHLLSVSLMRAGNQIRLWDWLLGMILSRSPDVQVVKHRGEKIFNVDPRKDSPFVFFIRGNDLFFTSDTDNARLAVDRLATPGAGAASSTELSTLYGQTPPEAPLRGAIINSGGELERVWREIGTLDPSDILDGVRGVVLSGGLVDGDTFRAEMSFLCSDASLAAASTDELERLLRSTLEPSGLPVELQAGADGDWVRVDVQLSELSTSLERLLDSGFRGR
jgi:hypothetical protein